MPVGVYCLGLAIAAVHQTHHTAGRTQVLLIMAVVEELLVPPHDWTSQGLAVAILHARRLRASCAVCGSLSCCHLVPWSRCCQEHPCCQRLACSSCSQKPIGLPGRGRSKRLVPVRVAPSGCPNSFETVVSTRCQLQRENP